MTLTNEDLQVLSNMFDAKLHQIDTRLDGIDTRLDGMDKRFDEMYNQFIEIDKRLDRMDDRLDGMDNQFNDLYNRVASMGLHLENVTDRNIQLLAENFIDLTNKLNQAVPAANKNLAYEVKVNYLIEEVEKMKKEIKEKILTA